MKSEPAMSEVLEVGISGELAEKIREHGVETYPYECCGALLGKELGTTDRAESEAIGAGRSREIRSLHPLLNRRDDSPRNRFSVTAEDVREAEKAARAQGLEVLGWYHLHPHHPAAAHETHR